VALRRAASPGVKLTPSITGQSDKTLMSPLVMSGLLDVKKTMAQTRSTSWSLTINNPTDEDREQINIARQKGWKIEGQTEKGAENGVIHYQMMLTTPQVRFSAVKKIFTRAHIEPARNVPALLQYVHKEETKVGDLPSQSARYPSLTKFWDLVYQYCLDDCRLDCSSPEHPQWYIAKGQQDPLAVLDAAADMLIRQGYFVETLAVNPQTRSAFQKFSLAIFRRAYVDRQTDRQHQLELDAVDVPRYNIDMEHNKDADANTS